MRLITSSNARGLFCAVLLLATAGMAQAQTCPGVTTFNPCEMTFDAPQATTLDVEFRSPEFNTFKMPAFWNGKQLVVRFSPTEPGTWVYRITSSAAALQGKTGEFVAADSGSSGFIQVDNTRAWSYTARHLGDASREAQLWMGFDCGTCLEMDPAAFEKFVAERAAMNFNHAVLTIKAAIDPKALDDFDAHVRVLNEKSIFTDIQFADSAEHLRAALSTPAARDQFAREMVARYGAYRVTWQGVGEWESGIGGRKLLREIGMALKKYDPYQHPRSTGAKVTSSGLFGDGWMTHIVSAATDGQLGSIEALTIPAPRIGKGDSGEGFARRLWAATVNGQYPSFNVTSDSEAKAMLAWYDLMGRTRYWEMEPYFDVDNARALYLTGIDYIVFIERPGTVDVLTERKGYQVYWLSLETGELDKRKKDYKGERFSGKPPGEGAWVLHLSRDGRKEGMARSYHFASKRVVYQEVETHADKVPFELASPKGDTFQAGKPIEFEIKLTKETRATRDMGYVLTAEATVDGQGARVLATGDEGEFTIPVNIAADYSAEKPAIVNLHLAGRNANGKVYAIDRVIRVTP